MSGRWAAMIPRTPRPGIATRDHRRLAAVALAVLCLIWGYNWVVMKIGLRYANPLDFAAWRNLLAAVALFVVLIVQRRRLWTEHWGYALVLGLLQISLNLGLVMWALETGAVGRTSVIAYTMPFWVLILAWPILGERLGGMQYVAVFLAIGGLGFIVLDPLRAHGSLLSSVLATVAAISWAGATIIARHLHSHHQADLFPLTAWQLLFGAIPLIAIAFVAPSRPVDWSPTFVGALAFNALFASALAMLLWMFVTRWLRAGTAGVGMLAAPVIGIASAWIQLGERPDSFEGTGMFLIVAGLSVLTWLGLRAQRKAIPEDAPPV